MISFVIKFSTGETFPILANVNETFNTVLNNVLIQNNLINKKKIEAVLFGGNKIDMNNTLLNNNIGTGNVVLVKVENQQQINNTPLMNVSQQLISPLNINSPLFTPFNPTPNLSLNNPILVRGIDFLINGCHIPPNFLDNRGNVITGWRIGAKSGPLGNLKDYSPPLGWIGIGLNVLNQYDNQDNSWLGENNNKGEWYIAYHGIKSFNSISGILFNGFRRGPFQDFQYNININPLTRRLYPYCGVGVYFIPDFNEAKMNTLILNYLGMKLRVIFMCRLNPYKVRIVNIGLNKERWIVNGDELNDPYGRKRDDEVRPYRILICFEL